MPGQKAPVPCPKCGGDMWNNISGKRNPKAPDYACKDKDGCGAGVWLKEEEKRALTPAAGSQNGTRPTGGLVLDSIMYRCHESAIAICNKLYGNDAPSEAVVACAHSLFIARCRGEGILNIEKPKAAAPPPPPPPPPEPEYIDYDAVDEGVPF